MPLDLVRLCRAARDAGHDFPTIWQTVLRGHPLVSSIPVQTLEGERALLEIPLITGHRLYYDSPSNDYSLLPIRYRE